MNNDQAGKSGVLPEKLSDLIATALADMQRVRRLKEYRIDLDVWHAPSNGKCSVCFAGAVMAGTLQRSPDEHLEITSFANRHESARLKALNDIREGDLDCALERLGLPIEAYYDAPSIDSVFGRDLDDYQTRAKFYRQMRALSKHLAAKGL
jgi:hypothetical protein